MIWEQGNAYSLPTSRYPCIFERSIRNAFPLIQRLSRNAKMSTQIIVTRLVQILTFTHTSSSHFLPSSTISLSIFRCLKFRATLIIWFISNNYNMKQRFQIVIFQRPDFKFIEENYARRNFEIWHLIFKFLNMTSMMLKSKR